MKNKKIGKITVDYSDINNNVQFGYLLAFLQWNINFIRDESYRIDVSPELRDEVVAICNYYDKVIEENIMKDGPTLFIEIKKVTDKFHIIITKLQQNEDTSLMSSLLMGHVADILNAKKENKDIIEKWIGAVIKKEGPEEFQELVCKAKTTNGMTLTEYWEYFEKMEKVALALVKEKITGERKGLPGEDNYKHSIRVYEKVKSLHHFDDPDLELFLAALLHDIVEDGGVSFEELVALGFTRRTIELIRLCTHDMSIENKTERWTLMVAKLIEARDEEAWYIKLCDLADNLTQSHGLSEENRRFMVEVKGSIFLRLTEWLNGNGKAYHQHLVTTLENISK